MSQPATSSPDIIEIQPCTEEGLVTLEAKLGGKEEQEMLDPVLLCRYLNATPVFEKPRCSPEMGYGMLEKDGRKIHAFKTGKVIVRRAEGREQALGHLRLVSRTVWPAVRVNGGDALVVCLVREGGCANFLAPPADGGQLSASVPLRAALEKAGRLPQWRYIEESLAAQRDIARACQAAGLLKSPGEAFRRAESPALRFLCEVEDAAAASAGIVVLSLSLALEKASCAFERLGAEGRSSLWRRTMEAFEAVAAGASEKAGALKRELEEEGKRWGTEVSAPLSMVMLLGVKLPA